MYKLYIRDNFDLWKFEKLEYVICVFAECPSDCSACEYDSANNKAVCSLGKCNSGTVRNDVTKLCISKLWYILDILCIKYKVIMNILDFTVYSPSML
jgi:hypothetical protein